MKNRNIVDYIEIWPGDPEEYIRRVCKQFGLAQPVSLAPGKIGQYDNLILDATLADGSVYRLAHSPIQEHRGAIINRKRTRAELLYISRVRSAAGRAGAASRWQGVERRPTVTVRVYPDDAAELRAMPGTVADVVHGLLTSRRD